MQTSFVNALKRKGGGNGARDMLKHLKTKLTSEDFERFLDNTPEGDAFWPAYITRKLTRDEPDKYGHDQFAADVLHPRN